MTARFASIAFVLKSLLILWISMGGVAVHAQSATATANATATATATATAGGASAEDLIVLKELQKAQAQAQADQKSTQAQATATKELPTSDRPAIASDKLILNHPVIDEAHVLTASEKSHLENQLRKIYDDKLAQMAVVIVPTTDEVDIFDYALATANRWGLGQKDTDDGILMLVAINDRKIYTVTGYGVEGVLPDAFIKRITREDITPSFQSGQYAQGLSAGIARIDERLRADPETLARADAERASPQDDSQEMGLAVPFIVVLIIGSVLTAIFGRLIGSSLGATGFVIMAVMMGASFVMALVIAFILWILLLMGGVKLFMGGGRGVVIGGGGGFGGGGFGGGGFGGGGGSFGGGGAGGSW